MKDSPPTIFREILNFKVVKNHRFTFRKDLGKGQLMYNLFSQSNKSLSTGDYTRL